MTLAVDLGVKPQQKKKTKKLRPELVLNVTDRPKTTRQSPSLLVSGMV